MAFEAAPLIVTTAIVGITALELRDLCETAKDMDALNRALNPDETTDVDQTTVCSIAVPTREELKQKVSESSGELMSKFTSFVETFKE